jgi:hypothetical protein
LNLYVKSQPGINITATPNDTICAGTSIALIATGGASYSWSGGIVNGLVFTPLASGTYTVTVTGANGCTNTQTQSLVVNPLPSISIIASPNDTLCAGTSVSLTATGGTFYSWTGGLTNGTPFTPTTNATYIVTVTSANGCTKTQTQNIVVNPLPGITISTTPNDTLCAGTPLILTASGGASHTWSGGISNGVAFTPLTSGTYTVTATANNGCTNTQTQSIVIKPQPTVTVSTIPNDTICNGTSLILTATGGTSYSWSGGIVNGSAFTPLTSGIYTVTATGANGCTKTQTQSIVVNPLPSINITASPNDTVCTNDLVTLTASGGSTFSWTGGINNGTPFAASSNTTYTVTVTGANGCTQTQTQSVVVNTLPSISITTSPNDTVCTNDLVTLTANGGSAYSWTGGINNGIPFAASSNTTYTVTVTGANGCTQTQTQSIVVNSLPNISITVSPNDTVCANDFVTLAAGGGATYSWTGGIINGVSFMPTANGNYTVTVTDTNGCTNTQIQSVVVNVNITPFVNITSNPTQGATNDPIVYMASTNVPPPYIIEWYRNNSLNHTSITNTWSDFLLAGANIVYAVIKSPTQCLNPDSAKSNNLEIVNITGVGNVFPNGFSIYPNPTEYVLTIEGLEFGDEYVIYDALGKKLLNGKSIANSLRLDVGQYSNGIYHIHFSRNQLKWTAKFIRK